mgnify:CR=1 FL=1
MIYSYYSWYHSFEHLGIVGQLYEVFFFFKLLTGQFKKFDVLQRIDKIWSAAQYEKSAVFWRTVCYVSVSKETVVENILS